MSSSVGSGPGLTHKIARESSYQVITSKEANERNDCADWLCPLRVFFLGGGIYEREREANGHNDDDDDGGSIKRP